MEITSDLTTEVEELEGKLAATRAQLKDLATMGAVITRIHEIDSVLSVVMDMAIRLVDSEVGLLMIRGKDDEVLRPHVSWGVDEDFVRSLIYKDGVDLVTYCYEQREPVALSDLNIKSDDGISLSSVIAMPIQTQDKCLGVIVIINKTDGSSYTEEDQDILEMLLNFVAVAIDNSRMMKDELDRQKTEQEMAVARQIQETILPQEDMETEGAEVGAIYFPAREVGGDFYDIIRINDNEFLAVLGDVSSKGVPAALVMSASAGIIKSIMAYDPSISVSELAGRLNNLLANEIIKEREMFVTLFFARFDLASKKLTYCNAGHIPGLFWSNRDSQISQLPEGGPIVGQFADIPFKQGERELVSGDRLFLFTDGLTEAADSEGNLFGRERAEQVFGSEIGESPKVFCRRVKDWVDRFSEGASEYFLDDFTILQVRVK